MGKIQAWHIAPCGVNCAACYAFQRDKKPCPGCGGQAQGKPKHCLQCAIFTCETRLASPGQSCEHCSVFPCARLRKLDGRYRAAYKVSLLENLKFIHEKGMPAFLELEETRFLCECCGEVLSVQHTACGHCGFSKRLL